jgi:hypothetical protein
MLQRPNRSPDAQAKFQTREALFNLVARARRPFGGDPQVARVADIFGRYSGTQQTAFDNGSGRSAASSGGSLLERQVDRAISQVLGRPPGKGASAFVGALNSAFPANGQGQVAMLPATGPAISVYAPDSAATSPAAREAIAAGLAGELSVEQAILQRQVALIGNDALRLVSGLRPFAPEVESDRFEALRSVVLSELQSFIDESGRIGEPRDAYTTALIASLGGPGGHVAELGRVGFLDGRVRPPTPADQGQIASFQLLTNYAVQLAGLLPLGPVPGTGVSLLTSRARIMLPVVAEANDEFSYALDAIGYGEDEQNSLASAFQTLNPGLSDITIGDLTAWIRQAASVDWPENLADSGSFGLRYVTDQANDVFLTMAAVLVQIRIVNPNSLDRLTEVLTHERVAWSLDDLLSQVKTLADQAA